MNDDHNVERVSRRLASRERTWVVLTFLFVACLAVAGLAIALLTAHQSEELADTRTELEVVTVTQKHLAEAVHGLNTDNVEAAAEASAMAAKVSPDNPLAQELNAYVRNRLREPNIERPREPGLSAAAVRAADQALEMWESDRPHVAVKQLQALYQHEPDARALVERIERYEAITRSPEYIEAMRGR